MNRSIAFAVLGLALAAPAAAFEGTVTSRRITVKPDALTKLVGGADADKAKILTMSPDKLLAAKDSGVDTRESTITISGPKVRVDVSADSFIIMDADTGLFQVVNLKEHKAMEWSKEDMQAASDKLAAMPKGVEEQLAQLPADKRAQVEAMLKKAQAAKVEAPEVKLRETGKAETINGYKCKGFDAKVGDETTVGWVTVDADDLAKAFRSFAAAEQKIRPGPKNPRLLLAEKGLPIRVQSLSPAGYQLEEIVKVEPKKIAADLFKIPADVLKTNASGFLNGPKPK